MFIIGAYLLINVCRVSQDEQRLAHSKWYCMEEGVQPENIQVWH